MYKQKKRDEPGDFEPNKTLDVIKIYPSIPYGAICEHPVIVFDKLDGSNIRAEWQRKSGWFKFGTRNRLLDKTDLEFGKVPDMLNSSIGNDIQKVLSNTKYDRAMCFFEFHGPNSFAGMHNLNDQFRLTLIDVAPFKAGIIAPDKFVKLFGHLDIPNVLHEGKIDEGFIDSVRESTLPGMTLEGVVCKANVGKKLPVMFKQKSKAWLDKLRKYCGDNTELFRTLS